MPTYLYCLLPPGSDAPPAALRGLADAPVRALPAGPLLAWVSTLERIPAPTVTTAREHDRVAASALASGVTPLPARFGQRYEDDARCIADVAARAPALVAALARVAGMVEMTATAMLGAAGEAALAGEDFTPPAGTGAGRAYMQRLRAGARLERNLRVRAGSVAEGVRSAVSDLVCAEVMTVRQAPRPLVSLAHLIHRGDASAYRTRLATLVVKGSAGLLALGGPDAPYSFAAIADG